MEHACHVICFQKALSLKFLKLRKTKLKNLSKEKYRQSENKEFETFEIVNILLLYNIMQ